MKNYLVLSDIHGDILGCKKALEQLNNQQIDYILLLGDILYHGPRNDLPENYAPKDVISLLNTYKDKIIAVRGNCEAEVDQMVLQFPCMSTYNILPINSHKLFITHGHIYSPDNLPPLQPNDIFLSGHTHIYTCTKKDDIHLFNPGSVSLPKNNNPKTYALLNDESFSIYTLDHQLVTSATLKELGN